MHRIAVLQWTILARVGRARRLPATSALPIERIATEAAFETAATFRERFGKVVGVATNACRRVFASSASGLAGAAVERVAARDA